MRSIGKQYEDGNNRHSMLLTHSCRFYCLATHPRDMTANSMQYMQQQWLLQTDSYILLYVVGKMSAEGFRLNFTELESNQDRTRIISFIHLTMKCSLFDVSELTDHSRCVGNGSETLLLHGLNQKLHDHVGKLKLIQRQQHKNCLDVAGNIFMTYIICSQEVMKRFRFASTACLANGFSNRQIYTFWKITRRVALKGRRGSKIVRKLENYITINYGVTTNSE